MSSNAFDDLSRGRPEIQNPTQQLNFKEVAGSNTSIRSLTNTMSKMENINPNLPADFPNCHIDFGESANQSNRNKCATNVDSSSSSDATAPQVARLSDSTTPQQGSNPSDSTAPQGSKPNDSSAPREDQSWKSHANDQWVKDSLTEHPDWHAMEGLHPGEVAVGNWEPTKEEKKVLSTAVDKMIAENNNGPVNVTLPDGSVCTIEIVKDGGHGQTFNKGPKDDDTTGKKHRKARFGQPVLESDGPDCSSDNSADESYNANSAVNNPLTPSAVRVA